MRSKKEKHVHALVLAGGRGTRSDDPLKPKILQTISNEKLLIDLHFENLTKQLNLKITFLLGYLNEPIIRRIKEIGPELDCEIDWVLDKEGDTPVSAVLASIQKEINPESIFVIVLGDILTNVNYKDHVEKLSESEMLGLVLVHPNLHPNESDVFEYGASNNALKLFLKGTNLTGNYPARAIAGAYFIKKSSLEYFNLKESDIANGVIEPLFNAGKLLVENTFEYFQDTGTKKRLGKARKDYASGAYDLRGKKSKSCIFLDRDGTLIPDIGADRKFIDKNDLSSETIKSISKANESGIPVILVTNQPGIAKGFITVEDFLATQQQLESILNDNFALLDDFVFCPHHPEIGFEGEVPELKVKCDCRKPGTGMIKEIERRHNVDIKTSILIGDSEADCEMASNCGMLYLKVAQDQSKSPDISAQIYEAISRIKS